jgi:DNA-binding response OmpR family regulator
VDNKQGKQRTIFLIEEDDQTRGVLVRSLRSEGYRVLVAIDEEEALERIRAGQTQADLVLINLVGKSGGMSAGRAECPRTRGR